MRIEELVLLDEHEDIGADSMVVQRMAEMIIDTAVASLGHMQESHFVGIVEGRWKSHNLVTL